MKQRAWRCSLAGVLTMTVLVSCVTPNRIVAVPKPASNPLGQGDLSEVTFVLREFRINGPSPREISRRGKDLRHSFLSYVKARNKFARMVDGPVPAEELAGPALIVDATLDANLTVNRTYILDYLLFWTLGFISPAWGDTKVKLQLTAVDKNMQPILVEEQSETIEYSMTFFGWYRSGPAEDAFANGYERVFDGIAKKISMRRPAILAALGGNGAPGGGARVTSAVGVTDLKCKTGTDRVRAVAVLPLKVKRIEDDLGALLDELLVSNVASSGCFKVISAADINAMLGLERMKDVVDCSDASCAAEIGGALGAELMVSGTVGRLGDSLLVSLTVIDTVKSEVLNRLTVNIPNDENQIPVNIGSAVNQLLAGVMSEG